MLVVNLLVYYMFYIITSKILKATCFFKLLIYLPFYNSGIQTREKIDRAVNDYKSHSIGETIVNNKHIIIEYRNISEYINNWIAFYY